MPRSKISEYSATANSNTDVAGINVDEGCAPSGINNAIRAVMGHLKDFQAGTNGDSFNGPVGTGTAAAVAATTLTTSSTVTHNGGTANGVAYLNGSKVLTTGSALVFDGTNLGLGVTSPAQILELKKGAGANAYIEIAGNNNMPNSTSMVLGQGSDNSAYCWNRANAALLFGTNNTERARIDSSGNLLAGTTTPIGKGGLSIVPNNSAGSASVFFNRNATASSSTGIQFRDEGSTVGQITYTNTATTYATSSDYRLKNTVASMTGALAKVAALKPVTYKWNVDGSDSEGFIAHELAEVCPQAVVGEKDAVDEDGNPVYQGIDTSFLVATLTAAIQEQQAIIEQLRADVETLKGN